MPNIQKDLEHAMRLVAPVVASIGLALECKTVRRSALKGSIDALRKAADLLEGLGAN
jgi:hypothetical protein